jgi:peptidoglycan hydrolase-like protein with peptidoglycan-binding domain
VHPLWPKLTAFTGDAPLGVVDDAGVAPIAFLHSSLLACGYNVADDDEVDAILFGPSTAEALATLQACCNLPDTGIVDSATWAALVGETLIAAGDGNRDDAARHAAATLAAPPPWAALTHGAQPPLRPAHHAPAPVAATPPASIWPTLRRDDGGAPVALLHALLACHGYYTDDDETDYWTFGSGTDMALRTFQACCSIVDTGVTCAATWRVLVTTLPELGAVDDDDVEVKATVAAVQAWRGDSDAEALLSQGLPSFHALLQGVVDGSRDLSGDGRAAGSVWLLGEQRWSIPHK